eukprot:TRINITY_DN721_c1_g2_i2.p1 TRINITY_DN721_c1_g2~~TRINITY_DN721_c1_g2_i2.p1  ORF type:complete len:620 (-),score=120.72 TRINITY_DN721_c1_g2_i2:44-1903(-)
MMPGMMPGMQHNHNNQSDKLPSINSAHSHSILSNNNNNNNNNYNNINKMQYVASKQKPPSQDSALILASKTGNIDKMEELIDLDEDGEIELNINEIDLEGNTGLHWASFLGHQNVVRWLLDHGADVDIKNKTSQQTALQWACIKSNTTIIFMLLEEGSDLHSVDKDGYTCLHHASQQNDTLLASYLIQKGIPVNSQDKEGHTPLHWAAYLGLVPMSQILLQYGSDVNKQDNKGFTPLHWAAVKGNIDLARVLLSKGADSSITDIDGFTCNHAAEKKGFFSLSNLLSSYSDYYGSVLSKGGTLKQNVLWNSIGFIMTILAFMLLSNFQLWMSFSLICCFIYIIVVLFSNFYPGSNGKNTLFVGHFQGVYLISIYTYIFSILFETGIGNETYLYLLFNIFIGGLYIYLAYVADPGMIKKTNSNSIQSLFDKLENGTKVPSFCAECMTAKPIRSVHCNACNGCVAKFEYHCNWLGKCVGMNNSRFVLILSTLIALSQYWFLYTVYRYFFLLPSNPGSLWPITSSSHFLCHVSPLVYYLSLYHLIMAIYMTYNLYYIYLAVSKNITLYEQTYQNTIPYLTSSSTFVNPFDKGISNNFKDFFLNRGVDFKQIYFLSTHQNEQYV